MKVAISASGTTLAALVDPRFGRCPYFVMVETNSMALVAYANESAGFQRGAGIQAAGFVVDKGAEAVLTGRCGPNAALALEAAGIPFYEALGDIPIHEAVRKFLNREATASNESAIALATGNAFCRATWQRQGSGGGKGKCGGFGKARGGRGFGSGQPVTALSSPTTKTMERRSK